MFIDVIGFKIVLNLTGYQNVFLVISPYFLNHAQQLKHHYPMTGSTERDQHHRQIAAKAKIWLTNKCSHVNACGSKWTYAK